MNRKEFIRTSGIGCTCLLMSGILWSCAGVRTIKLDAIGGQLRLKEMDFHPKNDPEKWLKYLIVESASLDYPVVVYRANDSDFRAYLLRCTHQGTRLNVYGDLISCPAHGSEFNNRGEVIHGPAIDPLKQFPAEVLNKQITIRLV